MKISRRNFLRSALAGSALALGRVTRPLASTLDSEIERARWLPLPWRSGIEHVVWVMMENRSFDHLLGWLPNADGRQTGLTFTDAQGVTHPTHQLAPDYTGCGHPDPDHSFESGRIEYNDGAMDGFLRAGSNDDYSIGYYVKNDKPFLGTLAENYVTADRFFCSILGPTYPNRIFQHAAQTDRLSNTLTISTLPTIWDRLSAAGVSGGYYFSNVPFLALWGSKYIQISHPYVQFLTDAATGNLPAVSFVDPFFTQQDEGTGNDDHPHADIRRGDAFLNEAFRAVAAGPAWENTVFIITYDEWGGFFDHVPPPRATAPNMVDLDLVGGKALLGFRVPAVIASPFTHGNPSNPQINRLIFDHTSVLKLIEWRWGLPPLTARDASSDVANLALALNLANPHPLVPELPITLGAHPVPCLQGIVDTEFSDLAALARQNGWTLP